MPPQLRSNLEPPLLLLPPKVFLLILMAHLILKAFLPLMALLFPKAHLSPKALFLLVPAWPPVLLAQKAQRLNQKFLFRP